MLLSPPRAPRKDPIKQILNSKKGASVFQQCAKNDSKSAARVNAKVHVVRNIPNGGDRSEALDFHGNGDSDKDCQGNGTGPGSEND